ncbi:MAG: hypothetical protein DDT19_01723 [Syntrophomonadaceae bacterium]|nr:hypothetical protein [Bacillota bacterium]
MEREEERKSRVEASLSDKTMSWWRRAMSWLIAQFISFMGLFWQKCIDIVFVPLYQKLFHSPIPTTELMRLWGVPYKYQELSERIFREHGVVWGVILYPLIFLTTFGSILRALVEVAAIGPQRELLSTTTPNIPSLEAAIVAYQRGYINYPTLLALGGAWGFGPSAVEIAVKAQENLITVAEVMELYRRGKLTDGEALLKIKATGMTETNARKVLQLKEVLPGVDVIREMYLRGEWGAGVHDSKLAQLGYSKESIEAFKKVYFYIPPAPDLIRMAVREAFSPEVARRFGQYEDFPPDFAKWAAKQGISEDWAKAYWAAHWELPSVTMGYEMLHRGVIGMDDLKMLLRAQDVMPFWREKLIAISYAPFTRVDTRRMYRDGVLDRAQVKRAYLDIGYDDWKAEKMTEWTIIDAMEEERGITKSEIVKGFVTGLLSEKEMRAALVNLNYGTEAIEFYIADAKLKRESELKELELDYIKVNYQKGSWDFQRAEAELGKLNLTAREIDYYLVKWTAVTKQKTSLPTRAELKRWLINGYITAQRWVDFMRKLGFSDELIGYYAKEIADEMEGVS